MKEIIYGDPRTILRFQRDIHNVTAMAVSLESSLIADIDSSVKYYDELKLIAACDGVIVPGFLKIAIMNNGSCNLEDDESKILHSNSNEFNGFLDHPLHEESQNGIRFCERCGGLECLCHLSGMWDVMNLEYRVWWTVIRSENLINKVDIRVYCAIMNIKIKDDMLRTFIMRNNGP